MIITRSTQAAAAVARMNTFFPLMPLLGLRWARTRPWEGMRVAVNAHLTTLTASLMREMALGGGEWVVCACNPETTDLAVVDLLREEGIEVETGGDLQNRHLAALDHHPTLIADVGFELLQTLLDRRPDQAQEVSAAIEITRTGINRLRRAKLPFPVINLNDGRLKSQVENRHGVGGGLWSSVTEITGIDLSGRRVLVVGYGPVGEGLAEDARALGAIVAVVERDPIRRLVAHYDGYVTPTLADGLARTDIAVTATGTPGAIPLEALRAARSGVVLVNAGHGGDEIEVKRVQEAADEGDQLGPLCMRYKLPDGPWLTVLGRGHPLNIVTNAGSPETVLVQFALLGLTLEWLVKNPQSPGEIPVPEALEAAAARMALEALGQP